MILANLKCDVKIARMFVHFKLFKTYKWDISIFNTFLFASVNYGWRYIKWGARQFNLCKVFL